MNKTLYKNWLEKHFIPFYQQLDNPDKMFLCEAIKIYCNEKRIIPQDNAYIRFIQYCILRDMDGAYTLHDYLYERYPEIDYSEYVGFWRCPPRICYLRELADRITPHAVVKQTQTSTQSEPKENLNESI